LIKIVPTTLRCDFIQIGKVRLEFSLKVKVWWKGYANYHRPNRRQRVV